VSETVDILRRARERISDPAKWWQGDYRDSTTASNDDCCVCAIGACGWAASGDPRQWVLNGTTAAVVALANAVGYDGRTWHGEAVGRFNDTHAHHEVIAAFDRAIELEGGA
jgi:hypothetical protein